MKRQNVEFIVQAGLGIILVILYLLGIGGMYQIREYNQSMSVLIHNNHTKVQLAHEMRDSIRLRQISLNKMLSQKDYFIRDEELHRFYEYAGTYRQARAKLHELKMGTPEKIIHAKLTQVTRISQPLNKKAAELIADDAEQQLIYQAVNSATENQQILLGLLDELVEFHNHRTHDAVHVGTENYDRSLIVVLLIGVIVVIGALFVVRKVSKFVSVKNKKLAEASIEARTANKTKSAFLANMSHEIRTPLTAIIGFAETILDSDQTIQDRIDSTRTIIRNGRHLLQIINDILDLSKVEAQKLELEKLEISPFELLADVVAIVKPLADSKGLTFKLHYEFPLPKVITSDLLRLKQILINLTNNAVKFTNSGHVIISVRFDKDEKCIKFNIIDSGIGMTEEQMINVFNAFTQADSSTTRKFGGTGLGLSLSKELAKQLGGDITVQSLENTGSQFELTLYVHDHTNIEFVEKDVEILTPPVVSEPTNKLEKFIGKALLAEDNADNQRLLTGLFNKLGIEVDTADNGKIALAMAADGPYDIIFMDMQMPVLGGLDATKQLRSNAYDRPIVALTANAMKKDRQLCFNAGCDDFLTKPVDRKKLFEVVEKYLQKSTNPDEFASIITSNITDDEPELADIVEKFCASLPDLYISIKQLTLNKDWSGLSNRVHQLKGTGGGMGFPILTEIAGKIEFQIANEDFHSVDKLIHDLGKIIERITAALEQNEKMNTNVKLAN